MLLAHPPSQGLIGTFWHARLAALAPARLLFSGTRDDGLDNNVTSPAVLAGEITSRLSADTTTVSDQICLNLNVGLRSLTQAAMVLVFMFRASWRLSVITFIIIPAIILITKVYGAYYRQVEI